MALKIAKACQSTNKGKSGSSDSWAFMEEIDAPMWVDLALEGRSNKEDQREDSWFHSMHPFHQRSFRDLVSASPLFVKVKGRVPKSVPVSPSLVNLVSKSRGHPSENRGWSRSKPAQLHLNLSELNKQRNCHTRQSGEKPLSLNSNSNANEGSANSLHKPGDDNETQASLHKSNNETMSKASITASTGSGKELKNPTDAQAIPSGDVHYQSTISDFKAAMPRKSGLLHMLKMSSLRRSAGTHPLRVEVKDEQQPKDRKSSSKSISSRSSIVANRETSSIGSSNGNSHNVKNESQVLKEKTQTQNSTISPTQNNRKKSSIGSSNTVEEKIKKDSEAVNATYKADRASREIRRMQGWGASVELGKKQEQLIRGKTCYGVVETASRRPSRQVSNVGPCQQKTAAIHHQRFNGEKNTHTGADHHQKSLTVTKDTTGCPASRRPLQQVRQTDKHQKSLTSTKDAVGCQASRQPLQQVINMGLRPQKSATLHHQRFPGKENAHLRITQHQKSLTNTKDVTGCQAKLKESAQSNCGISLHSVEAIRKWEKNHGHSYFSLKQSEREKANREIQNSKPCYR